VQGRVFAAAARGRRGGRADGEGPSGGVLPAARRATVARLVRFGARGPRAQRARRRYFYDIAAQILGTSDGPFNLLLNSLATAFVLEIDEVIFVDMPSHNFYGVEHASHRSRYARRLRLARNRFRDAVAAVERAPRSLRSLYDATSWLFPLGVGGCVFQITLLMQHYTSKGQLIVVDDDSYFGAHHTQLTKSYNWLVYGLLAVILVDLEVAVFVVAADGGESSRVRDAAVAARGGGARAPRAAAASLAWLLFTGAVLVVARIVVVRWVLGNLLPFGMSAASLPLDFWDSVDPTPNRPEDRYDYDYDYGEAAYGNGADYAYGGDYDDAAG